MYIMKDAEEKARQAWQKIRRLITGGATFDRACEVLQLSEADIAWMRQDLARELWVVRLYDGFDNQWCDITKPVKYEEALKVWQEHTRNGTQNIAFKDIDYYRIFPFDTQMLYSNGFGAHD